VLTDGSGVLASEGSGVMLDGAGLGTGVAGSGVTTDGAGVGSGVSISVG
jgi:hypothetical protein